MLGFSGVASRLVTCKKQKMLPGEAIEGAVEPKARRLQFGDRLGFRHLVQRFDRDGRVLAPKLCQHEPSILGEALANPGEHLGRMENSW